MLPAMAGIWLHARTTQAAAAISAGCGQWTLVSGVNPGAFNDQLFGVAAISASDVWAVEEYVPTSSSVPSASMRLRRAGPYAGIPQERALILHYRAPAVGLLCP